MKSHGFRSGTRKKFKKQLRHKGMPNISTYLQNYKQGDYVDIVVNSAVNKSMPHKTYHGRTGKVFKVDSRTVGVKVKRIIGNSQIEENLNIRIEHLKKSRCREEFLNRSKKYFEAKKEALARGEVISAKRVMEGGRKEVYLSMENNEPVVVGFEKFCDVF
ncbi:60S ribosomal protein L21A [Conglomerata obtusa]